MKSIILGILILTSNAFADTKTYKGIIRESSCNRPSGLGYLILETMSGKVLEKRFLKVNSQDLCASQGPETKLTDISFEALFLGATHLFEVNEVDGFVTSIEDLNKVDYVKYTKKMKGVKHINQEETIKWWLSGPTYIQYNSPDIDSLVEKYTKQ